MQYDCRKTDAIFIHIAIEKKYDLIIENTVKNFRK